MVQVTTLAQLGVLLPLFARGAELAVAARERRYELNASSSAPSAPGSAPSAPSAPKATRLKTFADAFGAFGVACVCAFCSPLFGTTPAVGACVGAALAFSSTETMRWGRERPAGRWGRRRLPNSRGRGFLRTGGGGEAAAKNAFDPPPPATSTPARCAPTTTPTTPTTASRQPRRPGDTPRGLVPPRAPRLVARTDLRPRPRRRGSSHRVRRVRQRRGVQAPVHGARGASSTVAVTVAASPACKRVDGQAVPRRGRDGAGAHFDGVGVFGGEFFIAPVGVGDGGWRVRGGRRGGRSLRAEGRGIGHGGHRWARCRGGPRVPRGMPRRRLGPNQSPTPWTRFEGCSRPFS